MKKLHEAAHDGTVMVPREPTPVPLVEGGYAELATRMRGRADFIRDQGGIKSAELMEQGADAITFLAAPPAAPADDHATPSGGQEAGPQEDRIEAAYWRFDARHKGYSQWKSAPMSERDAFKAEMRNALEAEKVRTEMRLVARGWRRPDAPAAPAPVAQKEPDVNDLLLDALKKVSMNAVYVANNECSLTMSIVREVDAAIEKVSPTDHGIVK